MKLFILFVLFTGCLCTPIQQGSQINADGSYSFFFDNNQREGRQFRDETRNADGTVVGKYGYQDPSGALRIVKYTAGKDGFVSTSDGIPVVGSAPGQPVVWSDEQPIILEAAPLSYAGVKGGPLLTERDQQKHLTSEEDVEPKEEETNEENKPDEETNVDSSSADVEPKSPSNNAQNSPSAAPLAAKQPKKQVSVQDNLQDRDQTFPQVLSGQRRLVEGQQVYAIKGRVSEQTGGIVSPIAKQHIVYHNIQHQVPVGIQDQRQIVGVPVSQLVRNNVLSGVNRPVIQQSLKPVQVIQSRSQQPSVGDQRQVQYLIQPVIPQNIGYEQRQYVIQPDSQQVQVLSGGQVLGVDQRQLVDQRLVSGQQNVQQVGNIEQRRELDEKYGGVVNVVQPQVSQIGLGVDQRQVHVLKPNSVQQIGVVTHQRQIPVVQTGNHDIGNVKVVQQVVRPLSTLSSYNQKANQQVIGYQYVLPNERQTIVSGQQHVLVQNPQSIGQVHDQNQAVVLSPSQVGWQVSQPIQQYSSGIDANRDIYYGIQQQYPISDLQAYYQSIRDSQVSSIGQISNPYDNQYVSQIGQFQSSNPQQIQYSGIEGVQGIQDSIRRDDSGVNNGRQPDLSLKPLGFDGRQIVQRPGLYGTKTIVNV